VSIELLVYIVSCIVGALSINFAWHVKPSKSSSTWVYFSKDFF